MSYLHRGSLEITLTVLLIDISNKKYIVNSIKFNRVIIIVEPDQRIIGRFAHDKGFIFTKDLLRMKRMYVTSEYNMRIRFIIKM